MHACIYSMYIVIYNALIYYGIKCSQDGDDDEEEKEDVLSFGIHIVTVSWVSVGQML